MESPPPTKKQRFHALDALRGWFIATIIVDHLGHWPSIFSVMSGEIMLWTTAAEGFVIISGFLVGYVRGFKGKKHSFAIIASKLVRRAALLYFWTILATLIFALIDWHSTIRGIPSPPLGIEEWREVVYQTILFEHAQSWVYFLYLYAIFLAIAPLVIWLLRKNRPIIALSATLGAHIAGALLDNEWLSWQLYFFVPAIIGFYYPAIIARWTNLSTRLRTRLKITTHALTATTITMSVLAAFYTTTPLGSFFDGASEWFTWGSAARFLLSSLWFMTLVHIFESFYPHINRYSFGIIRYFGTHSLTAYIMHGFVLTGIFWLFPPSTSWWVNSLLGLVALLSTYLIIRIPIIKKLIPR